MPVTIPAITGGQTERYSGERTTFAVKAGQTVRGGRLVEITASLEVQEAAADSLKVIGVAMHDADPAGEIKRVSVAHVGFWDLVASGAIAAGDRIKAGAAGVAVAIAADVDPRLQIGMATEAVADTVKGGCVQLRLGGGLG